MYCNFLCPTGSILSILSRKPLIRFQFNEKCISCGICSRICKTGCINVKSRVVESSSCVVCFDCISACPKDAMEWGMKKRNQEIAQDRREFLKKSVLGMGLFSGMMLSKSRLFGETVAKSLPVFRKHPVTPPGSGNQKRFHSLCTACHACVSACPTKVIEPALFEYGLAGIAQPRLEFERSYCNYECVRCSQACPTGVLKSLSIPEKQKIQMGQVRLKIADCIVITKNQACGACAEHCPTGAVSMVPYRENLTKPEINDSYCVGCGACEHICPALPSKAIWVEGLEVHGIAIKKPDEKMENKAEGQEFPF